jgi:uncharacterized protein (DUF4415 family)
MSKVSTADNLNLPPSLRSRKTLDAAQRAEAKARALAVLEAMTDEEDAQIRAAAECDPDAPPVEEILRRKAGRPPLAQTKRSVHLRLDEDVVRHFEAGGKGWQTRVNAALRKVAGLK